MGIVLLVLLIACGLGDMEIIEDGVITGEERPLMEDIMRDITEIVRACTEVRIATKGE